MNRKETEAPSEAEINECNEVGWAKEVAAREKLSNKRLTPKTLQNLDKNANLRRACRTLELKPGEEKLLIFDPQSIKPIIDFDYMNNIHFSYDVIDPETSEIDVKISRRQLLRVDKETSGVIDAHLIQGVNVLRIQKIGTSLDYQYIVTPVWESIE